MPYSKGTTKYSFLGGLVKYCSRNLGAGGAGGAFFGRWLKFGPFALKKTAAAPYFTASVSKSNVMKCLIVEDEFPASKRLQQLIRKLRPEAEICGVLDSVEATVKWLNNNPQPDLAFLDIQLGDGLSFDIFHRTALSAPVIFTTAYDQYTLKAFKQDSVDYLLKPIEEEELAQAFLQYEQRKRNQLPPALSPEVIQSLLSNLSQPAYKTRFIIKIGQQLSFIETRQIRYFYSEAGIVYAHMEGKKRHAVDYTLDALEPLLDPTCFFRLNRKVIAHIQSIRKVAPLFNGRLQVKLLPAADFEVAVSRDRAGDFREWLGGA